MLKTGIFPDKLKIAKVIPLFKKDDENLYTNYRPISLLPTTSKVFEQVIFKQLHQFVCTINCCLIDNMDLGKTILQNMPVLN